MAEEEPQDISIEDLELSLEVYEIEAEEKLKKLQGLFAEKGVVDLSKMFYEEKSSLEIKFQNIISDLTEFLINQEISSTDKLRKTFYRIIENPLNMTFKVSRFQIFKLRLDAFDIELEPIDAVCELGTSILENIGKYQKIIEKLTTRSTGGEYKSFDQFLEDAQSKLIQDLIFTFYSYLRKGGAIIKKEFQHKVRVVDIYNKIEGKVIKRCVETEDVKTLKELSILNYELYLLQNSYDVLCFYLKVPLKAGFADIFKELEILGQKSIQNSNFNIFILIFLRYSKEILLKLDREGIDSEYSQYIEQVLNAILELWGCRLCYYQEFYDIFKKLLSLHPNKSAALLKCLRFNPELKKDDIVLLRVNFKHDIIQKQSQLLSLMKPKTVEEINTGLSALYHQTVYNLDFKDYSREQILELVNHLNGNSSLAEFFGVTERAFKQWNHSIDFTNPLKYLQGQFKFPSIEESKMLESFRLLNNLCIFQQKSAKDYDKLVKAGSIQKVFFGFANFLFNSEQGSKLISDNELVKTFLTNNLLFLQRICINAGDWEPICLLYSSKMNQLSQTYIYKVIQIVKDIVTGHFDCFSIRNTVTVFKNIVALEEKIKNSENKASLECAINSFMKGTQKKNQEIKLFRFFHSKISDDVKLTQSQATFLKENACLNQEVIQPKNLGCFTLSELEIITNPVQFDKVMDNYYFSLDKNAKKFVQFLTIDWVESQGTSSTISLLRELITKYPISIPLLCSSRVTVGNSSNRFIEIFVRDICEASLSLIKKIVECRCIRYRNGRDYVREEIIPNILKETILKINSSTQQIEHFELLALCLSIFWPSDLKMDLIQNSIEVLKYQITQSKSEEEVFRLSNAHNQVLKKFFEKKEVDMRKTGLKNIYEQQVWNQKRIKLCSLDNENQLKSINKVKISEHIMVTPFMTSQDFDSETTKLDKIPTFQTKASDKAEIDLSSIEKVLSAKTVGLSFVSEKKIQNFTTVDLRKLKYNIESHLGSEIKQFCMKQGFKITTNSPDQQGRFENIEQNITFVQYYIKEYQIPQIKGDLILQYLHALLQGKVTFSTLFSNVNNTNKLFAYLILLLNFYSKEIQGPNTIKTTADKLLNLDLDSKIVTVKKILAIFSQIGYTNLWAQSYNSLKSINYLKELREKTGFKEEGEEETLFSWVLRICLENEALKDDLDALLGQIFRTRPKDQTALMYKVSLSRAVLNLIMKSLQIKNLSFVSLLFHSNYNNLRLYTDQLHEGLKALGMSSKNRAYNQYVQLSKDLQDEEFYSPMKLFKQNFSFFIRIQKEGYKFKREEEQKIGRERVLKALRSGTSGDQLHTEIEKVIEEFEIELEKLQYNIASRVKAFYLATKLRDLSYQNSITVCLLYQILSESKATKEAILEKIQYIEIFSLMMRLYNELVRFQKSPTCKDFLFADRSIISKEINICTTRRYSHSMSKVYEKCDLELDEVIQRCLDQLKYFFITDLGKQWLSSFEVYPPFLIKSFIDTTGGQNYVSKIRDNLKGSNINIEPIELQVSDKDEYTNLVKAIRELRKDRILTKNAVRIKFKGTILTLSQFLTPLKEHLVKSETFNKSKDGILLFNKYKTSEKTLEEIELLGYIVGYCVYNNIEMDLPIHSSLLAALGFSICDLHDLLDVDFKIWQDLRNVMSIADSKTLNLNFSYMFESLQSLKQERIELIDKGTSKKVNNLNRDQYCDLVCCYLLYNVVSKQLNRFMEAICFVCPKQLLSSLKITDLHRLFIKKHPKYSENILRQHMKKRGLVLPNTVLSKGKRIQNLKDYQSIQWLCEIVEENTQIKTKIWRDEQNIFVCTWMGQGVEFDSLTGVLLLGRLKSKEELKQSLSIMKIQ